MKDRREHRTTLVDAAMEVLKSVPVLKGNTHVFPGSRSARPLSNMALLQFMRGMGYGKNLQRGEITAYLLRRVIAAIEDPGVTTHILKHLSERDAPESRPPARGPPGLCD